MAHPLRCRLLDEPCSPEDPITVAERAKACAQKGNTLCEREKPTANLLVHSSSSCCRGGCEHDPIEGSHYRSSRNPTLVRCRQSPPLNLKQSGFKLLYCSQVEWHGEIRSSAIPATPDDGASQGWRRSLCSCKNKDGDCEEEACVSCKKRYI